MADKWYMYQVQGSDVKSELFDPDKIPDGWYDSPGAAKAACEPKNAIIQEAPEQEVKISRFARKLADDLGVDIGKVVGTGNNGTITKDDITNHYNLEA